MNLSTCYPQQFNFTLIDPLELVISKSKWIELRGFNPKNSLWHPKKDWLVQPLFSEYNEFLGYQARDVFETNQELKYKLSSKIWHYYVKTDKEDIQGYKIICEGTIDCSLLRRVGLNAYTCLGLKKERLFFLRKQLLEEEEKLFFCFDNDAIGKDCANILTSIGLFLRFPVVYKDINEFLLKDKQSFIQWIKQVKELTKHE